MFEEIYSNKRVLITGHTGFKGSWLAIWLKELGANVYGYALEPPSEPNLCTILSVPERICHQYGDIRDYGNFKAVCQQVKPEIVFHLAAQPLVRLSYDEPKVTFDTNVGGTINVLEAVRHTPSVRVVICVTSDKCYENREWIWGYRECDPMGGHDPYSASKGCAELVFHAYMKSFFSRASSSGISVGAASARAGNVIGGGDWGKDRLLPDCVRSLSAHEPIRIRRPFAIRPWQHVLDPLGGYLLLGARLWERPAMYNGAWNFGPDDSCRLTVRDVVEKLISLWGSGAWEDTSNPAELHEAGLLKLCCDKAHSELDWHSVFNNDECLQMTAEWYKKFYSGHDSEDMYNLCLDQIRQYEKKFAAMENYLVGR